MSRQVAPQPGLVKREEKHVRIRSFLLQYLDRMGEFARESPTAARCLLIARSADSPVARTVLTFGVSGRLRKFSVRAIFAFLGTAETVQLAEACRASDWSLQVHWARDIRLLEAHEQLVLGSSTSWIGDSMRRDPLNHDACELYAPDHPEIAQRASLFFERLWQATEPVLERSAPAMAEEVGPQLIPPVGLISPKSGPKLGPRTSA